MIKVFAVSVVCCFAMSFPVIAQDTVDIKEKAELAYQKRIKKEYLSRVYIPSDLADAFIQLNELIEDESKKKFLSVDEVEAAKKLHFSLGRWIIYNWGFYEGSRLSHYLRGLGLTYPDDMARFIIITYHRNLKKSPLDVKPLIEGFINHRKEAFDTRRKEGKVLHEEKRKVTPPTPDKQ